jgi:hypothetical protein
MRKEKEGGRDGRKGGRQRKRRGSGSKGGSEGVRDVVRPGNQASREACVVNYADCVKRDPK